MALAFWSIMNPTPPPPKTRGLLGSLFVLTGLIMNPWFLGRMLSPDGTIQNWLFILIILVAETHFLALGIALLVIKKAFPWSGVLLSASVYSIFLTAFLLYDLAAGYRSLRDAVPDNSPIAPALLQHDPLLGWKPIPNAVSRHTAIGEFDVRYEIDENGFRTIPKHPRASTQVFVVGDSYTFGVGVNNPETFASLLASQYFSDDVNVTNLGVMGYGFRQMFQRYLNVESTVRQNDLVLFAPISWDIPRGSVDIASDALLHDSWASASYPVFRGDRVERCFLRDPICFADLSMENAPYSKSLYQTVKAKLGYSPEAEALRIVGVVRQRTEQKGARFVLTFLPVGDEELGTGVYALPLDLFNSVDLLPYMSEYAAQANLMQYRDDGHYTSFGHRVAAQAIARTLWDRRMLAPKLFRHEPSTEPHVTP